MNSRRQLETLLGQWFPFLPPACRLVLDRVSQDVVLQSLRASLPSRRPPLLPAQPVLIDGQSLELRPLNRPVRQVHWLPAG
jgi:hypothetical protein